ncbi:MAG: cytochrome d ubiquinol oxidase subunit II [Pirellulales bacterium]|nr:cytochrome d ubiquinol oxidase subunit II [Pirellulales bacterium]
METLWFCLLALMLATYVVLDGFDFGVGILHLFVARNGAERRQVLRSVGPVWDGNEVWLIALGGTMLAAFPKLLATAFAGFYLPLTIVLWLLMFRALGIELRHQVDDRLWKQFWDVAFALASLLLAVVIGAALGNVVRGVRLQADGTFFAPLWTDFRVSGDIGILDWFTILYGVATAVTLAHHGALWLAARTDGEVFVRSNKIAERTWPVAVVLAIAVTAATTVVQPNMLANLKEQPWIAVFAVLAVTSIVAARSFRLRGDYRKAFFASCLYLYSMMASGASWLFPYLLPGREAAGGLTAAAATSAESTQTLMLSWWAPGMCIALVYTWIVYRALPKKFLVSDPAGH